MLPKYSKMAIAASTSKWRAWVIGLPISSVSSSAISSACARITSAIWRRYRPRSRAGRCFQCRCAAWALRTAWSTSSGPAPWTTVTVWPVAGFSTTNWSSVDAEDQRVLVLVRVGACEFI